MYTLGALLLLAVLLGVATALVNLVFSTLGLSATIGKIPIMGANWGLVISVLMMWLLDIYAIAGWVPASNGWDEWLIIVGNGAIVYGMIPVKDAVISMVNRGLRA